MEDTQFISADTTIGCDDRVDYTTIGRGEVESKNDSIVTSSILGSDPEAINCPMLVIITVEKSEEGDVHETDVERQASPVDFNPDFPALGNKDCPTTMSSLHTPALQTKRDATENTVMITDGGQIDRTEKTSTLTDGDGRKIHQATHPVRRKILLHIVGHPTQAPSVFELQFYLTDVNNRSVVENHLEKLENVNLVQSVELGPGERSRDLPHKFWTFADGAREFLEENNVIPSDPAPLQGIIARTEKPEKVERYEEAPRPPEVETIKTASTTSSEEIDEVLKRYKKTGDERQAGRDISQLEDDEDGEASTKKSASEGILEQLLGTVERLEQRVNELEKKTPPRQT